jgi:hypothetical protein
MNKAIFVILLLAVLATACTRTRGPDIVVHSQLDYNKAVAQVVNEELLLNIVRRRYYEPPQFVSVSSITTQITTSGTVGIDGMADSAGFAGAGVNGSMIFTDAPTITITPEAGEEIASALTKRMSCSSLGDLANAGYRFDLLLALMAANMTNLRGPQVGLGKDFRSGSTKYVELLFTIKALIEDNQLTAGTFLFNDTYSSLASPPEEITQENQISAVALGSGNARYRTFDGGQTYALTDRKMYPAMWMEASARESEEGKRVMELLNLDPDPQKKIWVIRDSKVIYGPNLNTDKDTPRDSIRIQMRSFYAMMNFLSYGVRVPPDDEQKGRVFSKDHYDRAVAEGRAIDLRHMFIVYWSKKKPKDAYIAVFHRGVWFYIKDSDHRSKRIFNAVHDLFNLEVVPTSGEGAPLLTIPVG